MTSSVERHLGNPRPVALSRAATDALAIVANRQPIARAGIELIRGSASDSALDTLLQRGPVTPNTHHLFVTTRAFLNLMGLRDLADLPYLEADAAAAGRICSTPDTVCEWSNGRRHRIDQHHGPRSPLTRTCAFCGAEAKLMGEHVFAELNQRRATFTTEPRTIRPGVKIAFIHVPTMCEWSCWSARPSGSQVP